jgi:hypothetical protein
MAIDIQSVPQEELPNLSLEKETFDFFFRICGYTPDTPISQALANPNFGFFSKKYEEVS